MLSDLTDKQLVRLYNDVFRRMSRGDGYQPYGYDDATLAMTKPAWYRILKSIQGEGRRRQKEGS